MLPTYEARGWDVIGDVHGCLDELMALLEKLGYRMILTSAGPQVTHPNDRKVCFVGDLVDRGPSSLEVMCLVREMLQYGHRCVMGNHDEKLLRALKGNPVRIRYSLQQTLTQLDEAHWKGYALDLLTTLPTHVKLTVPGRDDYLVVVHAGIPYGDVGKDSKVVKNHCLRGESSEKNALGYPIRTYEWAASWKGVNATCVFGHDSHEFPHIVRHNVIGIDTGCAFGGALTAFCFNESWADDSFMYQDAAKAYFNKDTLEEFA